MYLQTRRAGVEQCDGSIVTVLSTGDLTRQCYL